MLSPRSPVRAADPIDEAPLSDSVRALARRGVLRKLRKGAQIINEGDHGDTLFIVLQGRLRAYSANAEGREVTFGEYGPGEYLGEMSLDGGPRSANVETLEPTLCAVVTRASLQRHLAEDPAFAFELLAKVIRRARQATVSLRQIALNDVYGRLKALLEESSQPEAQLGPNGQRRWPNAPSQKAIGQRLGCSREMVSKLMKDLERGGYLVVHQHDLLLLKPLPAKW